MRYVSGSLTALGALGLQKYATTMYAALGSPAVRQALQKGLPTERAQASFGIKTASRLRAALRFLQGNRPGLTNVYLGEQLLTQMKVDPDLVGRPQVSIVTALPEQFRNMGLGKKIYGEVMRRQPLDPVTGRLALLSDLKGSVSPEAQRVWRGMAKRPGYRLLDYTQSPGYTPQFEASLPPPARLTDPLPLDRRLLGRPRVGGGY